MQNHKLNTQKEAFDVTGEQVTNVANGIEQVETLARCYINCTKH